jgi:pimeloyl-ACP methyl ester carboxylesterase
MTILTTSGAIVLVAAIAATLYVRRYPFEIFARSTRSSLAKNGMQRSALTVATGRLVYWKGGKGPPLVLVHGVNDQAGTWAPVVAALSSSHRLLIPDLPGHGESDPASGPLSMPAMVEALDALIDHEAAGERIALVGNSMGGWISTLWASAHGHRVASLVLEDSSGMAWDLTGVPLVPADREQAARAMRAVGGPDAPTSRYLLDAMIRRARTSAMGRIINGGTVAPLLDSLLPNLSLPVTIIWGELDGVLPLAYAEALVKKIPNARFHVIERCGHIPHRQQPQRFSALALEALGGAG